jgi:hypothetical protein
MQNIWTQRWENGPDARQTRIFFPKPDPKRAKALLALPQNQYSKAIRALTGHDFRRRHQGLVDMKNHGLCRLCDEEKETFDHLFHQCPGLMIQRTLSFNTLYGQPPDPDWAVTNLTRFLADNSISAMEDPLLVEQN